MKKTKIDWCDCTINPVVGCKNGCKYCYAERMNRRFHWVQDWKSPTFFPERLKQLESKTPQSIFIDSMSDIGNWEQAELNYVLEVIANNKQHKYIALTKTSVKRLHQKILAWEMLQGRGVNLYVGKSITTQEQANLFERDDEACDFLSIEPLLEPIDISAIAGRIKTIIVGAETGNRKNKVVPQKKWIYDIVKYANLHRLHVFMKESLREIMGDDFRQDRLPWEIER